MNILCVSSFLPYPLYSGGHVRLYNILALLAKSHTLFLVCEKRGYQTQEDIRVLKKICKKVITVDRKPQWAAGNILKSGFGRFPFLLVGHSSQTMKSEIQKIIDSEKIDLIHVETFYVMRNIPQTDIPVVLAEHNIEYQVYERYMERASFAARPLLYVDIAKMKYWERYYWNKATKLVAVSESDKQEMKRNDVVVVPNGVDIKQYQISNLKSQSLNREKRVLFIGDFRWVQNSDAAKFIIKDIWPVINKKFILWIVGREIPQSLKDIATGQNIVIEENSSKDTAEIFQQADVLLAPIRIGGGTSFKVLEAMASGVPVITTSLGIQGIKATPGKNFLLANTTEEFVHQLTTLLTDKKLYENIAKDARKLIEEEYNWRKIVSELERVYKEATNS